MIDEETRKSVANSVARNKKFVDEHTGDYVSKNYGIPKKATFPQKQDQDVHLKLVVVGDVGVGKTALLQTKMNGSFPTYLPTVCDGHSEQMSVDNYNIQIGFWDTHGNKEDENSRTMSYGDASIFMICFSVVDNSSFEHVIEWWIPEVRRYSPTIPILLCGTKIDLRSDENCVKELHEKGLDCISSEEGVYMAKKKGCVGYVENSAKLKQNLNETFESVVRSCGKVGASSSNEKDKCSIQ